MLINIVDLSGWVEYFTKGTNSKFFVQLIQDMEKLLVPSICIYEVFKRLLLDLEEEGIAADPEIITTPGNEVTTTRPPITSVRSQIEDCRTHFKGRGKLNKTQAEFILIDYFSTKVKKFGPKCGLKLS